MVCDSDTTVACTLNLIRCKLTTLDLEKLVPVVRARAYLDNEKASQIQNVALNANLAHIRRNAEASAQESNDSTPLVAPVRKRRRLRVIKHLRRMIRRMSR